VNSKHAADCTFPVMSPWTRRSPSDSGHRVLPAWLRQVRQITAYDRRAHSGRGGVMTYSPAQLSSALRVHNCRFMLLPIEDESSGCPLVTVTGRSSPGLMAF
jgi:hypothetical protein